MGGARPSSGPLAAIVAASWSVLLSPGCYLSHERRALDAPPEPPPAGRLELLLARAWCESMASCVRSSAFLFPFDEPLSRIDVELCVEHGVIREHARRVAAPWDAALDRGDARLDDSAIEGCLDAIREATCLRRALGPDGLEVGFDLGTPFGIGQPGLLAFDERCDAMYVLREARPVGASCEGPLDCERGAFCGRVDGDLCARECVSYDGEGDPCESWLFGGPCRGPHLACISGRCSLRPTTRLAGEGEVCGTVHDEDGMRDERCALDLECVRVSEDAFRCVRASAGEGEPCNTIAGSWCVAPLLCLQESFADPQQTCGRLELASEEGARCATETRLLSPAPVCDPRAGLVCEPTSRFGAECVRRRAGSEGAWCSGWPDLCARPLVCVDDACRAPPEGARCVSDDDCAGGVCERGGCVRCE